MDWHYRIVFAVFMAVGCLASAIAFTSEYTRMFDMVAIMAYTAALIPTIKLKRIGKPS